MTQSLWGTMLWAATVHALTMNYPFWAVDDMDKQWKPFYTVE